jgi:hypothetical protein
MGTCASDDSACRSFRTKRMTLAYPHREAVVAYQVLVDRHCVAPPLQSPSMISR